MGTEEKQDAGDCQAATARDDEHWDLQMSEHREKLHLRCSRQHGGKDHHQQQLRDTLVGIAAADLSGMQASRREDLEQ